MKKIALIYSKTRPDTIGMYIERAMVGLHIPFDHFSSKEMEKIPTGYDLYFRVTDGNYETKLPEHLRPSLFWVSDMHLPASLKHMKRQAGLYDLVLCFSQLGVERLQSVAKKIGFVSFGCDPLVHRKQDLPDRYDIGFVGTDGGVPRKFILQELRERYTNSYIGLADYRKMSEIYSQSKIGFNFAIRSEGMTMRSFEIPACGALLFMQRLPKPWGEELGFKDRENIVYYDNLNHLVQQIDYYLSHEDERKAVAAKGYELVHKKHTYRQKVQEALALVKKELNVSL